ncbi:hypothetical protein B0H13DRAFT_2326423 [Mycena leptocephala]|nr:hypothetical protein B0H13DRAFT_2326423 [Mycena leptocephala]
MSSTTSSPDSPPALPLLVTQYELLQLKREEARAKTRARTADFCCRLKQLPAEQQEPFKARACHAQRLQNTRNNKMEYHNMTPQDYTFCDITMCLTVRRKSKKRQDAGRSHTVPQV